MPGTQITDTMPPAEAPDPWWLHNRRKPEWPPAVTPAKPAALDLNDLADEMARGVS